MAILATQQWWIRTDGNELNGGGFDSTISGAGTNYSDQASPQLSLTDLACLNNTTLTSVTGGFTAAMIGNIIRIASGTNFTAGYYMVIARASTNSVTLDRNPTTGANASAGVGRLGGAHADFRNQSNGGTAPAPAISTPLVAGNTINVRGSGVDNPSSADYVQSGYYSYPFGSLANGQIRITGYNGRPGIQGSGDTLLFYNTRFIKFRTLKFFGPTGGVGNAGYGFVGNDDGNGTSTWNDIYVDMLGQDVTICRETARIIDVHVVNTGSTSAGTQSGFKIGTAYNASIFNSSILDYRGCCIDGTPTDGTTFMFGVVGCLIARGKHATKGQIYIDATGGTAGGGSIAIMNNTIDSGGADGIQIADSAGLPSCLIQNNNITNNTGYGVNAPSGTTLNDSLRGTINFNNYHGNGSGTLNNLSAGTNDLTVDPQYVNSGSNDFTPQNTLLKGAADPQTLGAATNYQWIGAIQPQGSAGGGGFVPQVFE